MAIEIATAYVSILPETAKLKTEINKALGEVGKSSESTGKTMGTRISAGLKKTVKAGMTAAGGAAAGFFGASFAKGFGRLDAFDRAEAKFRGLGKEAEEIEKIMDGVNDAVVGTIFGLDEAAGSAAQLSGVGVEAGEDMNRMITLTADIATQANTSMIDASSIISKIQGAGKVTGETLAQLDDRAVGASGALADHLNVSIEEMRDKVSAGEVSAEDFADAMEKHIGGAAKKSGDTFQGAFSMMGSAMGRFGASLLEGPFAAAPDLFGKVTEKINFMNHASQAMIDYFNSGELDFGPDGLWGKAFGDRDAAQPYIDAMDNIRDKWETLQEKWGELTDGFKSGDSGGTMFGSIGASLGTIAEAVRDALPPILEITESLGEAAMGAAVVSITGLLATLAPILADVLVPILESLAEWMGENQELVNMLVIAFAGLMTARGAASTLDSILKPAGKLAGAFKGAGKFIGNFVGPFKSLGGTLKGMPGRLGNLAKILSGGLLKGFKAVTGAAKMFGAVIAANPIGALITVIALVVGALIYFFTQTELGQEIWQKFVDKLKEIWAWVKDVFANVWESVSEKWDEFTSGIADIWDGVKEKWDEFITGASEAWEGLAEDFQKAWQGVKDFFQSVGDTISDIWNSVVNALKLGFTIIATVVIVPFKLAWEALTYLLDIAWNSILKPMLQDMGEWFQKVWNEDISPMIDSVVEGWEWLKTKLGEGVDWIKTKIQEFGDKIVELWNEHVQPYVDLIGEKWQELKDKLAGFVEQIRTNIQAFGDKISELWNEYVQPILDSIVEKWNWLKDKFTEAWNALKSAVFDAWEMVVTTLKDNWDRNTGQIADAWNTLKDNLTQIWNNIKSTVFDAWNSVVDGVKDAWNVATEYIREKWDWLRGKLDEIWQWVDREVFGAVRSGLDTVQGWFESGVQAITDIWNGLKKQLAEPINWVINWVYNDGIKKVFDGVAEKVGLDARLPEVKTISLATGGFMPGYTPGRDVHKFYSPTGCLLELSGGEPVMRPEFGRVVGKNWVNRMNHVARTKGEAGVKNEMLRSHFSGGGMYQAHARGGFINYGGALSGVQNSHARFVAQFFPDMFALTSATRQGDSGYHGQGLATDWQAQDGHYQTQMPTPWSKALANAIYTNFPNSAELIHWPLDGWQNLKHGNPADFGAENANHANHIHWATANALRWEDGDIVLDDVAGAGGGSWFNPMTWLRRFYDGIIDKLPSFDLDGFGDWAKVPGAALKTMGQFVWDWALDKLTGWAKSIGNFFTGNSGEAAESYRPLIESILREKGLPLEWADSTVRRLDQESSGNPQAQNNWDINAVNGTPSKGVMQVIDPTFATYKDPGYDDIWNPEDNIRASMNYAMARYGSLPNAYDRPGGYDSGGWLPPTPGGFGAFYNHTGKPEAVLTDRQWQDMRDMVAGLHAISPALSAWAVDGVDELKSLTIAFQEGLHEFTRATEDQDRMGTPEEWAQHFGSMAAVSFADDALGLLGLGGIVGQPFNEPFTNLVNAAADTANMFLGNEGIPFRFGHLDRHALVPVDILDGEGRRKGTKLEPVNETGESVVESAEKPDTPEKSEEGDTVVTVQLTEGDAHSSEAVADLVDQFNTSVEGIRFEVEMLKKAATTAITSTFPMMA